MENTPTGRTRLKPKVIGLFAKRIVLIHQTELRCEYTTCSDGHVEVEEYLAWFDTKVEWLLKDENK